MDSPEDAAAKAAALAAGINAGSGGDDADGSSDEGGFHGHGKGKGGGTSSGSGSGDGNGKGGSGGTAASEVGWYSEMIQNRFYSEWDRPDIKGGEAATVRIRVEKDGSISQGVAVPSLGQSRD